MNEADLKADAGTDRRRRLLELSLALALLVWRIAVVPVASLWRDWFAILCVYGVASILIAKSKAWPWVAGALSAALLAIYVAGLLPLVLGVLGISRE